MEVKNYIVFDEVPVEFEKMDDDMRKELCIWLNEIALRQLNYEKNE